MRRDFRLRTFEETDADLTTPLTIEYAWRPADNEENVSGTFPFNSWLEQITLRGDLMVAEGKADDGGWEALGLACLSLPNYFYIYVTAAQRNKGWGKKLALFAARYFLKEKKIPFLIANVPRENTAAIRVFSKARFKFHKALVMGKTYCQQYVLKNREAL